MYPAILSLVLSISLHVAQELGSLKTEINHPAPAEEKADSLTHVCTSSALDFRAASTNLGITHHTAPILSSACAVSWVPAYLSCSVLVSVLIDFCSSFCLVFYKMPCQAMVADRADVAENCRLFKDSGVKGNNLLATLC